MNNNINNMKNNYQNNIFKQIQNNFPHNNYLIYYPNNNLYN